MSSIKITEYTLLLDGSAIGYRYNVSVYNAKYFRCDVSFELRNDIYDRLNRISHVETGKPISGKIKDGLFITGSEYGVKELENIEEIKKFIHYLEDLIGKYSQLSVNFEHYVDVLRRELRNNGVEIGWDERRDENELCFESRFLGGDSAWSGGHGDICDADTLSTKVIRNIEKAIKATLTQIGKNVELVFNTGEKAWTYFYFRVK